MNKVITINLGGNAYQLEEGGYDALRAYLDTATARLHGNPDQDEILSDIETAIAEKFRALLGSHKSVVAAKEVAGVLAGMGPVEAGHESGGASAPGGPGEAGAAKEERAKEQGSAPRRLYRIYEGAMISGVCNGIAAYFNVDPTLVRLAFVFLTLFWGMGVVVYLVMAIVVPGARTPEEKAAASGAPTTAQEFIRRAKEGYYEAMRNFPDRKAHRAWARRFGRDMRAWAWQWRRGWHGSWPAQSAVCHPTLSLALPFLSLLAGIVLVVWLCALTSLLASGTLFGLALPASVPVWAAALGLFIAYIIITGPLKVARHVCCKGAGQSGGFWSLVFLFDAAVWCLVVAALLCLAIVHFPALREAIQSVPSVAHQAADDIQTWWKGK